MIYKTRILINSAFPSIYFYTLTGIGSGILTIAGMLTRNQLVLFFGRSRIVFYGFEFPAIFAFTSLCLRLAGCRQARQRVSPATRFVTQTLNFCHIRGFLQSNSSNLTSAACASCLNHSPCTSKTVTVTNRLFFALCVKIKLFVSEGLHLD